MIAAADCIHGNVWLLYRSGRCNCVDRGALYRF